MREKSRLDPSVDLMDIARNTPGASGADLANILNEAALLAARRGRTLSLQQDAPKPAIRCDMEKSDAALKSIKNEKKTQPTMNRAMLLLRYVVKHADPVDKVTIIPRGLSLRRYPLYA